ncbi:hypothetical protein A3733_17200 [Pseudoalteromonas shioyasakiensis]|nr:hypothetical protein A3733_17200 [Pseudoalteromonas shioyasakiensis]
MPEEICYEKPFLKEVIFRVDFPTPIRGINESVSPVILKPILKCFPISEPQTVHAQELKFSGQNFSTSSQELKHWVYHGKEREKSIIMEELSLTMTIKKYKSYDVAYEEFCTIVDAILKENKDLFVSRIGVRYVNSIELNEASPLEWGEYINEDILGIVSFHEAQHLSRAFHVLEYNFDGQYLKYQFGIPNPDYPALIKQKQFILDLDSYFTGAYDLHEVHDCINYCHDKIQQLFEKSITSKTRKLMK